MPGLRRRDPTARVRRPPPKLRSSAPPSLIPPDTPGRPLSLDIDTVRTISILARLRVPPEELPALARELSGILDWVEQLAAVDTSGIAPMASVADVSQPQRADVVTDGNCAAAILANAPGRIDDYFTVPKVVE